MAKQLEVIGFAYIQSMGETMAIADMTQEQKRIMAIQLNRQFIKGVAERAGASVKFEKPLPKWGEIKG